MGSRRPFCHSGQAASAAAGHRSRAEIVGWAKARKRRAHPSLAEVASYLANVAASIGRQHTSLNIAMEAAVRPVAYPRNQPMFHGIVVDVIDVTFEISFIANCVFPIAPQPYAFFPLGNFAWRASQGAGEGSRKSTFNEIPSQWKIRIVLGQLPYRMKMVGENTDRYRFKRIARLSHAIRLAKAIDVLGQQIARPIGKRYGEKERTALDICPSISWHVA